ncbi:aminoglycoside phosphotransferase family protein [Amycolatopsis tucumanensis]|uniref:aminoglycoside phosphotransferase family protein n=1 Tax=Amycolatopsis tucumanensis TaxID=401106 RepID=UPI001F1991C0|nr:aminoglycoside 3'-phosphotransferase/choline kinase family protein [Amycolatopsis tucumanensis]MCF6422670.1 aminoglycoside 3'-phosphotransferase/choline kinase family protein [Amycolatopsis tucumanensis]
MGLPTAETEEQFEALNPQDLATGVEALARRLGIRGEVSRFATGSLPVYACGDGLVLKLYPPAYPADFATESRVLRVVDGRLPVATPRVLDTGELDGWRYLLMTRLPGVPLGEVPVAEQIRLAPALGAALAALHALDVPDLGPSSWAGFVTEQAASAVTRQPALDQVWARQIPSFLDSADLGSPSPVLLHTEVMAEHVLAVPDGGGWRLSGLFDFEPAMRGAPEYEFAAIGIFVTRGSPEYLRALLDGYGLVPDDDFPARCLAYLLLHRYSNLASYFKHMPAPAEPTLEALAHAWWPVSGALSKTAATAR